MFIPVNKIIYSDSFYLKQIERENIYIYRNLLAIYTRPIHGNTYLEYNDRQQREFKI